MSEAAFGAQAVRLAHLAARTLGWRPAEFWSATPVELATALGLIAAAATDAIDRGDLKRMMESDDARSG